jgi:hypothetical protein
MLLKKINDIDSRFQEIIKTINSLQEKSDTYDENLTKNWLHFYRNEIIRFNERVKSKPEHVPTQEHYKSVFDNYTRYSELGGNGYIDAIMDNIYALFKIHHGFDINDLNENK